MKINYLKLFSNIIEERKKRTGNRYVKFLLLGTGFIDYVIQWIYYGISEIFFFCVLTFVRRVKIFTTSGGLFGPDFLFTTLRSSRPLDSCNFEEREKKSRKYYTA
jgi:hypothetical protein